MIGITSIGAYVPMYRLSGDEIARMWGGRSPGGEKAVAGYDEDSLTMGVAAALDRMKDNKETMDGLYFATTTPPYKEKQAAAIIGSAIDLQRTCYTGDFSHSLRAGGIALRSAIDAVNCGSAANIMVITSDCRIGAAQSRFEQILGDGAAAVTVGSRNVIAEFKGTYSIFNEFFDTWRTEEDAFERGTEDRFVDAAGYGPVMKEVIFGLMDKYKLTLKDFAKFVFYAPDARSHANMAKSLGVERSQVQDPLYGQIGNTGTAAAFVMLADTLNNAKPGERILFVTYGDGADAFIFEVTDNIRETRQTKAVMEQIKRKVLIDYSRYAIWKNLVQLESSKLAERPVQSAQCLSREKKNVLALYGVKCRSCGTPQYPASRVCVMCHAKDNFEDYKFSCKQGIIFTFSVDLLQETTNPPGVNGVVDFDGGGRLICEFTDCDPGKVEAGMKVEMTFRKLYQSKGINSYFWKGKPITEGDNNK
jgi:hydroxymethylglutaryl-CoA synthase